MINWYLAGSVYGIEPYAKQPPAMFADAPWSGHYALKPIMWSYAHVNQFAEIGWQFLDAGCGPLAGGGTCVTLRAPGGGGDYSVICETATATESQTVTFKVSGGLSGDDLCVWRTNKQEPFARQSDVHPTAGAFTLVLDPLSIYTISTTRGQQRGAFDDVPQAKPFPFPFYETYDHYMQPKRWGYLPYYTADICGVFEISDRPDGNGKCLRQVLDRKSNSWAPEWMPYTVLGDENWKDYAARSRLEGDQLPAGIRVHADLELVQFFCPACGRQHAVDVGERGQPPLQDFRLDP